MVSDITLTALPLLPDGLTDNDKAYRVGVLDAQGHTAYVFFMALVGPVGSSFVHIRLQMRLREERCCLCHVPLCAEDLVIAVCTEVYTMDATGPFPNCFVHTAWVPFPNCFVHTACVGENYRLAMQRLMVGWRAAQDYACWF